MRQNWLRVSRSVVFFSPKSRHSVSVVSLLQQKRLCPAFLCEDSAGLTCFAPTQRARSHETSRLSSRNFHDVRLKTGALSFALLASERILNATMSRKNVTQVQAEVQAAFDRDTFGFCCQEDRIYCCDYCHNQCEDQGRWDGLIFTLGMQGTLR